jgi:hypothetical protein
LRKRHQRFVWQRIDLRFGLLVEDDPVHRASASACGDPLREAESNLIDRYRVFRHLPCTQPVIGLAEHASVSVVPQPDRQSGDPAPRLEKQLYAAEVQGLRGRSHGAPPLRVEPFHVFRYERGTDDRGRSIDQAMVLGT